MRLVAIGSVQSPLTAYLDGLTDIRAGDEVVEIDGPRLLVRDS